MKRCKTCKHWEAVESKVWGECLLALSDEARAVHPNTLAVAYDFEGYRAGLCTVNNFGCVQWERKVKCTPY